MTTSETARTPVAVDPRIRDLAGSLTLEQQVRLLTGADVRSTVEIAEMGPAGWRGPQGGQPGQPAVQSQGPRLVPRPVLAIERLP